MSETICKTVCQYNREPIPAEDMEKLKEIALDYSKVKDCIYHRYGGIGSLSKIYPGYTVQNEMTKSGLRAELRMPSVYFNLAVFDALGDIKSQWTRTKTKITQMIGANEHLTAEEKHYLRFALKTPDAFAAIVNQSEINLPKALWEKYEEIGNVVDRGKLNRYLCRQVRKYNVRLHTGRPTGFSLSERAYRYADHGIYISTKQSRQRIFVPLTDNNRYCSQIYIKLDYDAGNLQIKIPINVSVVSHPGYCKQVGIAFGIFDMLTTDEGHVYGERLGEYQTEYAEWIREQTGSYNRNKKDNPGRKKYHAKKRRMEERLHSYINQEINRFLRIEQPQTVYMAKMPKPSAARQTRGVNKKINHSVSMWQRGYIRQRLEQKCREQSIQLTEVIGKDISTECSQCKAAGIKRTGNFFCPVCGYEVSEKQNTAENVLDRGRKGAVTRK